MSVTSIASRYAKSLIDLAGEQGNLEAVVDDMQGMKQVISNRDFYLLLKSPIVKTDKKISIFEAIFAGKSNPLTLGFINILARKGRERYLPEIVDEFLNQYRALKNISKVSIKTATPISDNILSKIQAKLEESEATRAKVEVESSVDESLIGGFVLEIGDKLYDASLAHKIERLKKEFS